MSTLKPLTDRQIEVLNLLKDGLAQKEVARRLGVSTHTVISSVRLMMTNLDARNTTHAVVLAIRKNYIRA